MANQLTERITLDSSKFDENIQKVIKKVEELKQQGNKVGGGFDSSMGKMIQKATGFNGSLTSLVGVVGKFGVGLGVVTTAGEAFGKMLHSSQTLEDSFGATQESVNTVVDNFFRSLASGDFSPFLNGMDNMISKAREAYNAMDELWNMAQSFGVQNARLNNQFNQNLNEIRKLKDKDDEESKKRVEELKKENQGIIETQKKGGENLYKKTIEGVQKKIAADSGLMVSDAITEKVIFNVVENDINNLKEGRTKYEKEYKEYLKAKDNLEKKYSSKPSIGGGGLLDKVVTKLNPTANLGADYQKNLTKLQNKYGEAIVANTLLQRYSDEELKKTNDTLKEGLQYQGVAIANDAKMLRYAKDNNEETSKGTKNGGKIAKQIKGQTVVYNAQAVTVKEISDNIKVLNDDLEKTKPNSEEYKKISKEIEQWKQQLEYLPFDEHANTIKGITRNVETINKMLEGLDPSTNEFKKTNKELEMWEKRLEQIANIQDGLKFNTEATSIKDVNNNINILNKQLEKTRKGSIEWFLITQLINKETKKLIEYQEGSIADLSNQISEIESVLNNENLDLNTRIKLSDTKKELQDKINSLSDDAYIKLKPIVGEMDRKSRSIDNASSNIGNIIDLREKGLIDYNTAKNEIEKINKELQSIGLRPIKVKLETDFQLGLENFAMNADSIVGGFEGIDNVVNNITQLSTALDNGANAWDVFIGALQTGMAVIQAVSQVTEMLTTLQELFGKKALQAAADKAAAASVEAGAAATTVAAKSGESIAGVTASGAKLPFPLNLAAIAAGIAAVVSAFAMIGSFANGGIVGGSSFAGDNLIARVNSGEMILNGQQQKRLFDLLDGGRGSVGGRQEVEFVIKGKNLVGVSRNYNDKMNKIK